MRLIAEERIYSMNKKLLIPLFLAGLAIPALASENEINGVDAAFIGEFGERNTYIAHANELNTKIAEEGFVLLKNDGTLPLPKNSKITVTGKSSINLVKGGAGSGALGSPNNGVAVYTLEESLTEAGFRINEYATQFYKAAPGGRTNGNDVWKGNSEVTIGETPIANVTGDSELLSSFRQFNDLAIQVISREGTEGADILTIDATDSVKFGQSEKHALELSDNEQALFDELHNHFDKILILLNSSNVFECDKFMKDPKVAGILWVGNPGFGGAKAIGEILCGDVNPSGRTVDTWTRDFTKDPSFQNFSDNRQNTGVVIPNHQGRLAHQSADTMLNADGTPMRDYGADVSYTNTSNQNYLESREYMIVKGGLNGSKPGAFVSYEEGIYNDYRYYETRYADMAATNKSAADAWYKGENGVVFPFGYGLSYTTFKQEIVRVSPAVKSILTEESDLIEVSVKVTNTGNVAGKDAVQLYWKAPYTYGGIEKADHVLCAFDKTGTIEPGRSQIIHLTFHLQDVADYDYKDANNNNHVGYELDEGDYQIMLMKNAHQSYCAVELKVKDGGIIYDNDRYTNNEVTNRFTDRGFYSSMPGSKDIEFTEMSRTNFVSTFPKFPSIQDRKVKVGSRYEEFLTTPFDLAAFEEGTNFEYLPEAAHKTAEDGINWRQTGAHTIKLIDMLPYDLDDLMWEEFINEFSWNDLMTYVEAHATASPAMSSIYKPVSSEGDGPQYFRLMGWVSSPIIAATFNPRLAHEQGECIGMESQISGKTGWWGTAVNVHRSPFGGRNFEYYSADPFLTGRIAAQVVKAATDRGVYCYVKHFAVGEQEKNREGLSTFVNEQALREIYLKPFQMVVQEGKTIGIFTAFNRLGNMEVAASYPLLTEVLRNEWGFKGSLLSDMIHTGNPVFDNKLYENITYRVMAGCNCQLDTSKDKGATTVYAKWNQEVNNGFGAPVCEDGEHGIAWSFWYACRKAVKEHMYMIVHSTAMQRGLTKVVGNTTGTALVGENVSYNVAEDFANNDVLVGETVEVYNSSNSKSVKEIASIDKYEINERCELPDGVTFNEETGLITGAFSCPKLVRIDVIVNLTFTDDTVGRVAYQYVINVEPTIDENAVIEVIEAPEEEEVDPNPNEGENTENNENNENNENGEENTNTENNENNENNENIENNENVNDDNNNENVDDDKPTDKPIVINKDDGCKLSVGAASAFVSSLALVGALLIILNKKRK